MFRKHFNVQILNSARFQEATGFKPPKIPITANTYAKHGYPCFSIFDGKASDIKGHFDGIHSENEMDTKDPPTKEKAQAVAEVVRSTDDPVVLLRQE